MTDKVWRSRFNGGVYWAVFEEQRPTRRAKGGSVIVTAALAWYDEAPEDLDRFVRALAVFCDRFIAVGGRYGATPSADRQPG